MKPSKIASLLLLLGLLAMPAASRAGEIVETRTYVAAADTPSRTVFYLNCETAPYIGGACFTAPPAATSVTFTIADATTTAPGAQVRFLAASGTRLALHEVCGPESLTVPAGTDRIQVFVNGVGTLQTCPQTATGTTGTITARFVTTPPEEEPGGGYVPSPPQYSVLAEPKQYVPSGDATVQVDVYRPNTAGRFPAIVWFDVYYKDDPGAVVNSERDYFVSRGFVFVHASSPGSNTSGGSYDNAFGPAEQQAAYDVIEWAAAQSWSNELVGMQGLSYAAIIEYFAAAMRPPHLVTIYPTSAYSDLYREIVYTGGNLQAGYPILWDANNRSSTFYPPRSLASDPATQARNYATTLAGARPILGDFLLHPHDDDFYAVRSPATRNALITVPAAIDVGWYDDMVYGGPINYETIGSTDKRLVIGPWGHSAAHRRADGRAERLRWFDHYLKGKPSGVATDPRATVHIARGGSDAAGGWVTANTWPLPSTTHVPLWLGADGSLSHAGPGPAGTSDYLYTPSAHATNSGPGEQVRFETPPLNADVTVVGYPELVLYGSTDAADTSWNVAVYDVAPGGSAKRLQRGWLRASARTLDPARSQTGRPWHTFDTEAPVPSGEIVEYRIPIWPFANTFPAGHRIRVELNGAREGPGGAPAFMPPGPATNSVWAGADAPSRLLLPVI